MSSTTGQDLPSADRLIKIIYAQTKIAKAKLDLGAVISLVADLSFEIIASSGAVVVLSEGDELVYGAASGLAKKELGLRLSRDASLSGLAITQNTTLYSADTETDPRVDQVASRRVGMRSIIVTPLKNESMVLGALLVFSDQPDRFDQADQQMLTLMADMVGASMAHASQYQQQSAVSKDLFFKATHDSLTGLANRGLFYDRLRSYTAQARRTAARIGVIILDLDGLKPINDNFGHLAGDAALKTVAKRLQAVTRESDTVARIGGDEFGLILVNVAELKGVQRFGAQLIRRIEGPFQFGGRNLEVRVSHGLAVFPDDATDVDQLIDLADQAMYATKRLRHRGVDGRTG